MKILIVDDQAVIRRHLESALIKAGHDTQTACDGNEALQKAVSFNPDFILLDVKLPGMDGFHVLQQLKARETTANIKVMMLTGSAEMADVQMARKLGAFKYITKPFKIKKVVELINKYSGNE